MDKCESFWQNRTQAPVRWRLYMLEKMAAGDGVDVVHREDGDQNEEHSSHPVSFTLPGDAYVWLHQCSSM